MLDVLANRDRNAIRDPRSAIRDPLNPSGVRSRLPMFSQPCCPSVDPDDQSRTGLADSGSRIADRFPLLLDHPAQRHGEAVGFVQGTVTGDSSDVAWVGGVEWQGRGYASEAASAMCDWLATEGVQRFTAHIHPGHLASQRVAAFLGMQATDEIDEDGEAVWAAVRGPAGHTAD